MASPFPATRADLDALPIEARAAFMTALEGSLWRLQRDDDHQRWFAVEDLSLIERFGFARDDFPHAAPPALPDWRAPAPAVITVTPRQARLALYAAGLLDAVESWVAAQSRAVQIDYAMASEWRSDWPLIEDARVALGLTTEQISDLFAQAATQ